MRNTKIMKPYKHLVQYYETDKMGITHHSNYIRWMEEARLDFLRQLGFDYVEFEKIGFVSPVIGINNVKYKKPTTVGEIIDITVSVKAYNTVLLTFHYEMFRDGVLVCEGDSEHCFISKEGHMIRLGENRFQDVHHKILELLQ